MKTDQQRITDIEADIANIKDAFQKTIKLFEGVNKFMTDQKKVNDLHLEALREIGTLTESLKPE